MSSRHVLGLELQKALLRGILAKGRQWLRTILLCLTVRRTWRTPLENQMFRQSNSAAVRVVDVLVVHGE